MVTITLTLAELRDVMDALSQATANSDPTEHPDHDPKLAAQHARFSALEARFTAKFVCQVDGLEPDLLATCSACRELALAGVMDREGRCELCHDAGRPVVQP